MFLEIDKKKSEQAAALGENGDLITYGELVDYSHYIEKMIPLRSLFFILCRNVTGSLVSYVSCVASRNVPLLLSADIDEEMLRNLIKEYRPGYIWMPVDIREKVVSAANPVSVSECEEQHGYCLISLNNENTKMYDELALLLTTSGSTGSPKLVRQSYDNIESNAASIAEYLELNDTERPITTLPMNYTYGLSVINSHLLCGAMILMTESTYAQKSFWNFFKEQKATSIAGVPFTYEILKKLRFFRMDLPSLKYMTQAGGKLLPELHKEYAEYAKEHGKRFYVMYGQTEATARMSYLPYDRSLEKYGSMGIAIPGGTFYLIDVDGNRFDECDKVGELVYEGPNVTLGYAESRVDLDKGDERGGVLITGDMAKRDRDGFYYIVGRKKRFLKIYGNRINLDECERMLMGQFEESEFACVGEDDHMIIYTTAKDYDTYPDDTADNDDTANMDNANASGLYKIITDYISGKTGLNFKAFEVRYIEDIPKNDSGKKNYAALQ